MSEPTYERCIPCGESFRVDSDRFYGKFWCKACSRKFPGSLLKATVESSRYALKLHNGELICFMHAEFSGEFVHLTGISYDSEGPSDAFKLSAIEPAIRFERGVDIRVADVLWCADCQGESK